MRFKINMAMAVLAVVGMLAGVLIAFGSASAGGGEQIGASSPVRDFQDHYNVKIMNAQQRGTSILVRDAEGISMNIDTTDLPVGAYSVWWVIFNKPSECGNNKCGSSDTGAGGSPNPAEASVLWATGGIVGPDREGHFSASIGVGLDRAPGEVLRGPALLEPMTAEVHLILRYHGSPQWDDADRFLAQQTIFSGNCDAFPCFMPQVVAHLP